MASGVSLTKGVAGTAFTFTDNVAADDTVVIGNHTYTFKASVGTTANEVKVGTNLANSITNLAAAINKSGGSNYGSNTAKNAFVSATAAATTLDLAARGAGAWINGIALTATVGGANTITANGATFSAVTDATAGAGNIDDFITDLMSKNQINSEVLAELKKLTAAAD